MKPSSLMIAAVSFIVSGGLAFLVIRAISMGNPELSFIVGAVIGSQTGAIMHHRHPGSQPTATAKLLLGVVLAACALVLGVILHVTANPFTFAEVSVPAAIVGSFAFPLLLFNTMWNALSKQQRSRSALADA